MRRNKNVWIVLIGEFIAGLGLWLGILGNLEFMQKYVPSDFMKSVILFIGLLAGVLVGPMAGRIIDQYEKKKVHLYAGFGRVISVIFMFFAIQFESIAFMIAFMVALQISAAFYFPALQSVIPLIVREHELLQMNGVHMNVGTIARIAGTSLGGILLVVMSLQYMYAFSMAAYALLFLSTFFLQFEDKKSTTPSKQAAKDNSFMEVFRILRGIPIAFTALILSIIPLLFIAGFNLMVINISEMQHDPTIKGFIYTIEGIAFMLGAFVIKRLSDHFKPEKLLYFFAVCTAFAHLSLFFSDIKWMSLTSFGLFGFSVGCFFPIMSTIFQTKVEKSYHGRLFSFRNMFERVMFQIVLLGTGFFLDTIGLQYMVLIFGVISLFIIFISLSKQKQYEKQPSQSANL
ncbi:MFS transporter [Bacillus anthracis]|uniref:MFS transporter n=1 Tax=Bacillus anthracis TaxID=1392 RepID=UPI000164D1D8|nr:MFS transporter [Bacillus anthracis]EDR95048.1 putative transporter [Bacillus anthracis str. A0442]MRR89398.1 MFS transporter [Bacillus anthracis]UKY08289.1 MFS transporter [Bacillus anthracis]HDR4080100.1 MFS transporter [Bacillus anthracis]HDR4097047.1 MFS transporter [Bacillus anthracis]